MTNLIRTYDGNPNLRAAHQQYHYSQHELNELIKCKADPIYFIEQYIKIVSVDHGIVPFVLYDFQKTLIQSFQDNRNTIGNIFRQAGKSTTVAAYFVWYVIFHDNVNCAILANKVGPAKEILQRVKLAYELLPFFLQQGIVTWNKGDIQLENGSKVMTAATSESGIRGQSINILFLDEFAHVPPNIAAAFFASVYPTISSGKSTKTIIISTPKGFNHFHTMYDQAEKGKNGFHPITCHWSDVPGRDTKWRDSMLKILGPEKFAQEIEVDFIGSSGTLIDGKYIKAMNAETPIHEKDSICIYHEPEEDHKYLIVCDPSEGIGQDYSAFIIYDITTQPFTIAAKFNDNNTSTTLPGIIYKFGRAYNDAHVLIETNISIGKEIGQALWYEFEYENVVTFENYKVDGYGIRTTSKTKTLGCVRLKDMIENRSLIVNDYDIKEQLSHFIRVKKSYQAESGANDDLVMCLVIFGWFTSTPEFKDLTNMNIRRDIQLARQKAIEDEVLPFGFIHTGLERYEDEN